MASMLEKIRKLNWVLQESPKGVFSFNDMCEILKDLMNANVYVIDSKGTLLGVAYQNEGDTSAIKDPDTGIETLPTEYADTLMYVDETQVNLKGDELLSLLKYEGKTSEKFHAVVPVLGGGMRWGTILMARYEPEFNDEDIVLAEVGATVVGIEFQRVRSLEREEEEREQEVVRMAISTLSYSETEAVQKIFEELQDREGILVASRIADKARITRSVIVNALRKLESAGVIESKSLGMKGTHIKVLNDKFYEELGKLK